MPNPLPERAGRAHRRSRTRRLRALLALTAVALPLVALAPVSAGTDDGSTSGAPNGTRSTGLPIGDAVPATGPMQVVSVVDGLTLHLGVTDSRTVAEALRALEIDRSPLDRIEPELHTPIDGPTVIRITRVELHERRIEVELPRETVRIKDPALPLGQTRVEQRGHAGLRVDTQLVLTVAGEVESRLIVDRSTVRSPLPRIERIGTLLREGETVWDALARCEAGGRWDAVRRVSSSLEYHGGLQFHLRTWTAFRPAEFPALASEATREQQIVVGERVLAAQGWQAWPACSRRLGLR